MTEPRENREESETPSAGLEPSATQPLDFPGADQEPPGRPDGDPEPDEPPD